MHGNRLRPRRRLWRWGLATVGIALTLAGGWAFWWEPSRTIVAEHTLDLPWRGSGSLRVAVLTDLHVGSPFNGIDRLREVVARTNAAKPDVICILGDLVIQGVLGGRFVSPEEIAAELKQLSARAGIFAVLGNHDAWLDHRRVRDALQMNGIRVLEESATKVATPTGPLWIAGVSDFWTGRHDVRAALADVPDDGAPVILMTHNPDIFVDVPDRVALTLAGHTHGGQVRLPIVGAPIVPSLFGQRFSAGHIVEEGRHMFVATGVGTSILPVRLRVPPAIALLTVRDSGGRAPLR